MNSNRQKRKLLKEKRRIKREGPESLLTEEEIIEAGLRNGTILPVDVSKITSRSVMPSAPAYYRDMPFVCVDCKSHEIWTARQQKRWYEEQGSEIESIAIRCRNCRKTERARKEAARKIHLEGLVRKREHEGQD